MMLWECAPSYTVQDQEQQHATGPSPFSHMAWRGGGDELSVMLGPGV